MSARDGGLSERSRRAAHRLEEAAGRWADRAVLPSDIQEHRLETIAARRLRARGAPVPEAFTAVERSALVVAMTAPAVLRRLRDAVDGPIVLFKGMEVAALYSEPQMRFFHDLDVIVPDAQKCQRDALAAGFTEVGDPAIYRGIHHLRPLELPGNPVLVEVHHEPKWLDRSTPPSPDALLEHHVPGRSGVDGVDALAPAAHALVLATHSWSNHPLWRLRDLLDIGLVVAETSPGEVAALARDWGVWPMWRSTLRALEACVDPGAPPTLAMRTWARNVRFARGRTVAEYHLERWLAPFWALPARAAASSLAANLRRDLRPDPAEPWRDAAARIARSMRAARTRKHIHDA